VNEDLKQAPKEIISSLKTKYESARAKEEKLKQSYVAKNNESAQQSIAGIQLGALNSEYETDKQYLAVLLAKQNDVQNTTGEGEKNNVSVAEVARLPRAPIGPPRMRNIMVVHALAFRGYRIGIPARLPRRYA